MFHFRFSHCVSIIVLSCIGCSDSGRSEQRGQSARFDRSDTYFLFGNASPDPCPVACQDFANAFLDTPFATSRTEKINLDSLSVQDTSGVESKKVGVALDFLKRFFEASPSGRVVLHHSSGHDCVCVGIYSSDVGEFLQLIHGTSQAFLVPVDVLSQKSFDAVSLSRTSATSVCNRSHLERGWVSNSSFHRWRFLRHLLHVAATNRTADF